MNPSFWRGQRVFITGHTGFKGSWLTLWLRQHGVAVCGYSLTPPTDPSLFEQARVGLGITHHEGDIRDGDKLAQAMIDFSPTVVVHMAAQPLVRTSYEQPVETYSTNVMGTVHLLEAIRRTPSVRAGVIVTSDKCYENREWPWGYRENEAMGGHDPYSNSKGCAELVTSAYQRSFFHAGAERAVAIGSARAGNVIGGGDWAKDRLLPDAMRAFSDGKPVEIRSPNAIRPWQHVLEPLDGYLTLAEHLVERGHAAVGGWNFGPSDTEGTRVGDVVRLAAQRWGGSASVIVHEDRKLHEAHTLRLDCSKARAELSWRPRLDVATAIEWTVDWYKGREQGGDPRALAEEQIRQYEARS